MTAGRGSVGGAAGSTARAGATGDGADAAARRPSRRRLVWAWSSLVVVVAAALAVGAHRPGPPATAAQRAAAIDAEVRCPSCDGISAADSSAGTAVEIRHVVAAEVRAGQDDAQIIAGLESRYGPSILLRPADRGLVALVWVLPVVAVAAGAVGLGVVFWRRRRVDTVAVGSAERRLVEEALSGPAAGGPPSDSGRRDPAGVGP